MMLIMQFPGISVLLYRAERSPELLKNDIPLQLVGMETRVTPEIANYFQWRELCAPAIQPIQTGAIVLTGTQCSGKTTMINELKSRGYTVVPEGIRDFFEGAERKGIPLARLKEALPEITATSLALHVERVVEAAKNGGQIVTDRGLGDFLAGLQVVRYATMTPTLFRSLIPQLLGDEHYWRFIKDEDLPKLREAVDIQIENLKKWAKTITYDKVLWLEPMPHMVLDGIRPSNLLVRGLARTFIKNAWHELGYKLTPVPAYYEKFPDRVNHVLGLMSEETESLAVSHAVA